MKFLVGDEHAFLRHLEDQGISLDTNGGKNLVSEMGRIHKLGRVYSLKLDSGKHIPSYSPKVFWKTLKKVEEQFDYDLFSKS